MSLSNKSIIITSIVLFSISMILFYISANLYSVSYLLTYSMPMLLSLTNLLYFTSSILIFFVAMRKYKTVSNKLKFILTIFCVSIISHILFVISRNFYDSNWSIFHLFVSNNTAITVFYSCIIILVIENFKHKNFKLLIIATIIFFIQFYFMYSLSGAGVNFFGINNVTIFSLSNNNVLLGNIFNLLFEFNIVNVPGGLFLIIRKIHLYFTIYLHQLF
ncbi:MAG: hypothetical protein FWF57_03140 [Defluviitaleaceae bacterium]|nr:hypothetical protein [Defluviitaleaceae bacterium]